MSAPVWLDAARRAVVQVRSARGGGSAFFVTHDPTLLLTNEHVVAEQPQVQVSTEDGRTQMAEVIARSAALDLALLCVPTPGAGLAWARDAHLGERVYALGHPWGRPWSLSRGVVSGLGRATFGPDREGDYVRSDVTLAPGNSGGPLLNARGEVLGVNSMVWAGGLGVAVPATVAGAWLAGTLQARAS